MTTELSIETPTHGRVLLHAPAAAPIVLMGFHGYTENADIQMGRLQEIAGDSDWTLVSVQGLHRFYRGRTPEISASWMTRQDREQMIIDNVEYADRVFEAIPRGRAKVVTVGFSQGVAMAFRAAVLGRHRADAIVAIGGDVPPELLSDPAVQFPPLLLARGETDDWYTASKLTADLDALIARGIPPSAAVYPGGHEWTEYVSRLVHDFISRVFGKD